MADQLAMAVHELVREHGMSDLILMVLALATEKNVNNSRIEHGDGGVLIVKCGEAKVSMHPGNDATVEYADQELPPDKARDVISALMVASCLALRERASDGSAPCDSGSG